MKGINYIFMGLWIILCFLTFSVCYGSSDFDECIKRAKEYCEAKKWDEAIDQYTKAISIRPKDAYLYYARGVAQYLLLHHERYYRYDTPLSEVEPLVERAISDFNKAIQLEPKNALFYFLRAKMRNKMISLMENAIILNQDLPNIDILQQANGALEDLTKAISLRPDLFFLFYERGEIFMRLKLYEKAASDFRRCIELKPSVRSFLTCMSLDYLPMATFFAPVFLPTNVFGLYSDDPDDVAWLAESLIRQGELYSMMGKKFQAVPAVQKACDLETSYWKDKYEGVWRVSYCRKAAEIKSNMNRDKRWVLIYEDFHGLLLNYKVFYDRENVKKLPDGHVMVWIMYEKLEKGHDHEYNIIKELKLLKVSCKQKSMAIVSYVKYGPEKGGKPVESMDFKSPEMIPVVPRTIGEGIYNIVCQEQIPKKGTK